MGIARKVKDIISKKALNPTSLDLIALMVGNLGLKGGILSYLSSYQCLFYDYILLDMKIQVQKLY